MSATANRYTCDQLGACQSRVNPCPSCRSARPELRTVSEGTRTARAILGDTTRPRMPQPYLLDTGASAVRRPAPLRYLKPAPPPPVECGFGVCAVKPDCTGQCRLRAAQTALQGRVGTSQRQALPEVDRDRAVRAHTWRYTVLALAVFWAGIGLYIAF